MAIPIFVASSTKGKQLALALKSLLNERLGEHDTKFDFHLWWRDTFVPGTDTLKALISECRKCEFAIVFLTRDDIQLDKVHRQHAKARDNCIFEAGLFMGGLGLDPERCFLAVSVAADDLPSDFNGITHLPFVQPEPGESYEKDAKDNLEEVANRIFWAIKKKGYLERKKLPYISKNLLFSTERPAKSGGKLISHSHVLVNSAQPLERGDEFAAQVMDNIAQGCKYRYFFHGQEANFTTIVELLQSLASVGLPESQVHDHKQRMLIDPPKVRENLTNLKRLLSIYFIKNQRLLNCCIHNAQDENEAICYLRYPTPIEENIAFVTWFTRDTAFSMARALEQLYEDTPQSQESCIFRNTVEIDLFSASRSGFKSRLSDEIREAFPDDLWPELKIACFGTPQQKQELSEKSDRIAG